MPVIVEDIVSALLMAPSGESRRHGEWRPASHTRSCSRHARASPSWPSWSRSWPMWPVGRPPLLTGLRQCVSGGVAVDDAAITFRPIRTRAMSTGRCSSGTANTPPGPLICITTSRHRRASPPVCAGYGPDKRGSVIPLFGTVPTGAPEALSLAPGTRPPTEVGARALRFRRPARRIVARLRTFIPSKGACNDFHRPLQGR